MKSIPEVRIGPIVPARFVLVSTARLKRPSQSGVLPERGTSEHVENCPSCKGNEHLAQPAIFHSPSKGDWNIRIVENLYPLPDNGPLPKGLFYKTQQAIKGYDTMRLS